MPTDERDYIQLFCQSRNLEIGPRTVIVEGTSDVSFFNLANVHQVKENEIDLLDKINIVAAGEDDEGGADAVVDLLSTLTMMSRTCLDRNGKPKYRFIGLLDNDRPGNIALKYATTGDRLNYFHDIFMLHHIMPVNVTCVSSTLQSTCKKLNEKYKSINCEIEDFIDSNIVESFCAENPGVITKYECDDKIHLEIKKDHKKKFLTYCNDYAEYVDLLRIIHLIKALRFYLHIDNSVA